ncbi:hypothetical protein V9T40_010800 [Parthenolecanium corni]|uniref:Major facilitator superfamily (MFS) profile domain-containing protein n=1 Tax=Parthenolecanium corni TaxID=536013 RepID=A0AAN9T7T4_9HEMI
MYAAFTDTIVSKKIVSKTRARKIATVVSHLIPGLALIMLAFNGENFPIAVISIYLCVVLSGAIVSGTVAGMTDMSPNYAGIIFGLCGALSHTTGFLNPILVGYLTFNNDTVEQWQYIFLISAGVAICSGLLFLTFWSSDLQEWDRPYDKVPGLNKIISQTTNENNRTTRDTLWLLTFFGFGVNYMLRININIAIVDMVKRRTVNQESKAAQCYSLNETTESVILNTGSEISALNKKYDWDEYEQNLVLSSYYWLHWVSQLPGGLLAHHYGSKKIVGLSNFLVTILTFAVPVSTHFSIYALIAIRFLQGITAGSMWPAMHSMVSKWIPPVERGKFMSAYLGSSAGAAFTYFICGYIIDWFGWEWVFYITGILGFTWSVTWAVFVFDTPQEHPWITEKERSYIEDSIGNSLNKSKLPIPWRSILKSRFVWANVIAQWGATASQFALLTHTPTYLKFIHGLHIKSTGVLSGLPHLSRWIFSFIFGICNQYQTCIKTEHFRKLATGLCTIGVGLLTLCLAFTGCNTELAIVVLFVTITLQGTVTSGPYATAIDMTPNFSSIVQGIVGSVSVTPGFLYPFVVGYLTQNDQSLAQWQKYFFIVAGLSVGCGLVDCICGSSKLQPWNSSSPKPKEMKPLKKNEIINS